MAINLFKINWKGGNYTVDIKNTENDTILTSIKFQSNDKGNVAIDVGVDNNNYSLEIPMKDFVDIFYKLQFIKDSISDNCITRKRFTAVIKDVYGTITNSPENLLFYVYINDDGDYSLKVVRPNKNMETYMDAVIDIPGLVKEYIQEEVVNKEENGEPREFSSYLAESIAWSFSTIVANAYMIEDYIYRHLIIEDNITSKVNELILGGSKNEE